jgi:hypothetical protein
MLARWLSWSSLPRAHDRVLLMPPYTSYETPRSTRVGWQSYLASLAALLNGQAVPYQIGGAGSNDMVTGARLDH